MTAFLAAMVLWPVGLSGLAPDEEPKALVRPTNLDKLNTEADEADPFSPDGLNLYYATLQSDRWEIRHSKRSTAASAWSAGKTILSGKDADFRSPFVRGTALFFASNNTAAELKGLKNFDIMQKIGAQAPLPLPGISE